MGVPVLSIDGNVVVGFDKNKIDGCSASKPARERMLAAPGSVRPFVVHLSV